MIYCCDGAGQDDPLAAELLQTMELRERPNRAADHG